MTTAPLVRPLSEDELAVVAAFLKVHGMHDAAERLRVDRKVIEELRSRIEELEAKLKWVALLTQL